MQKATVVGSIVKERKVPAYKIPCKVPFGSLLRKELSKKRIPVNRAGR